MDQQSAFLSVIEVVSIILNLPSIDCQLPTQLHFGRAQMGGAEKKKGQVISGHC